jgi:hypothetical protein
VTMVRASSLNTSDKLVVGRHQQGPLRGTTGTSRVTAAKTRPSDSSAFGTATPCVLALAVEGHGIIPRLTRSATA